MKITKIIFGYLLYKLVYKILEKRIKYNENINKNFDEIKNELLNLKNELKSNKENNIENNNKELVVKKFEKKSNINLKSIYEKIFNKKKMDEIKNNKMNDIIVLCDNKDNILLSDINNFLKYNFKTEENKKYKIKCTFECFNIKNIKLVITNNVKRFIYNYENMKYKNREEEDKDDENINKFEFILDNNEFDKNEINIYLIFVPFELDEKIKIENYKIEVYEKSIYKNINAIMIYNINDHIQPLYIDKNNILDYEEYINESSVFFI
jgi:hypothetical protein